MTQRRLVLTAIVAIVAAVLAIVVVRDVTRGGSQGQQDACTVFRQNNVPPPPGQNCP